MHKAKKQLEEMIPRVQQVLRQPRERPVWMRLTSTTTIFRAGMSFGSKSPEETMKPQRTIIAAIPLLLALPFLAAAQDSQSKAFHFWFQRDGGCVACAKMPPPSTPESFPEKAGIDVMFNGYNQNTGEHWQNQGVESYQVTYTYKLNGATHSAMQTADGNAASVVIQPYPSGDLNKAQVLSISVTATYSSGPVTKTVYTPEAFKVY